MDTNKEKNNLNLSRRKFIWKYIIGIPLVGTLIAFLYPVFSFILPIRKEKKGKGIKEVASLDEIPPGKSKLVLDADDNPVMVINSIDYGIIAVSAICTHLGCIVHRADEVGRKVQCSKPMDNNTHCVCHGGVFSVTGAVLGGPPPRPLPKYEVFVKEGKIYLAGLKPGEKLFGA